MLKFGAIPPGHVVKKGVTLVNNSVLFVAFSLSFVASIPELQEAKVGLVPSEMVPGRASAGRVAGGHSCLRGFKRLFLTINFRHGQEIEAPG